MPFVVFNKLNEISNLRFARDLNFELSPTVNQSLTLGLFLWGKNKGKNQFNLIKNLPYNNSP